MPANTPAYSRTHMRLCMHKQVLMLANKLQLLNLDFQTNVPGEPAALGSATPSVCDVPGVLAPVCWVHKRHRYDVTHQEELNN